MKKYKNTLLEKALSLRESRKAYRLVTNNESEDFTLEFLKGEIKLSDVGRVIYPNGIFSSSRTYTFIVLNLVSAYRNGKLIIKHKK